MPTVTQTIPNYNGGISEQPDQLKIPGQVKSVQNAIPDVVNGLYKRPGSERIGTTKLTNVQSNGSWFHYYRDETEGSYIGQVASDGKIRMWCTNNIYNSSGVKVNDAGDEIFVHYHTVSGAYTQSNYSGGNANHTSITSYLTPSSATNTEDVQALTINDTTFLNNRSKTVTTTGTTTARPHKNFAYIELTRTENGRQYSLNIYDDNTTQTINTATRLKIKSDTLDENDGSGSCPGIGTQVFDISGRINTSITITAAGSGYTSAPAVTFQEPQSQTGTAVRATAVGGVATITNNAVTGITVLQRGSGYTSAPTVTVGETWVAGRTGVNAGNQMAYGANLYTCAAGSNLTTGGTPPTHTSGSASDGTITWTYAGARSTATATVDTTRSNIVFRITSLGQQGKSGSGTGTNDYQCTYNRELTLLHGGQGWVTGDEITVKLDQASTTYEYTVEVTGHESPSVKSNVKAVRPSPTPFDADTAVTVDTILGGVSGGLSGVTVNGNALNWQIIGNGIYLYTAADADDFNVEVVDQDIMRVLQSETNDVTGLPLQCKHGAIVKIGNTRMSDEDDYYVKFEGENGKDGPGQWVECAKPGIIKSFNGALMPHVLQRQSINGTNPVIFLAKQHTWADREVGDDNTNPLPSFADGSSTINRVLFFRNRLTFLSGENVITARPGTLTTPNFWSDTALTVSAVDPIDITCASDFPSALYDAIEITSGLLCFSTNAQFLLASDDTIMNPDTAKLRAVSRYNYNTVLPPISLGQTVGYIDNSNKYSYFMELANVAREGEPIVVNASTVVPTLIPKNTDLITNSRENELVFFGKSNTDTVIGYRYKRTAEEQIQTAWFKWKFNNNLKYHFIVDDVYYYLDTDDFLQKINLVQADVDPSIDQDEVNYLLHLDNHTTIRGGAYNSTTKKTTFTHGTASCVFNWESDITKPSTVVNKLVIVDSTTGSGTTRLGRYAEPTITSTGSTFTVPGNWDYNVEHVVPYTALNASNEQITVTGGHGFSTGDEVRWVEGDSAAGGLTDGNIYYAISASTNNIALASSLSNANAGVAINITSQGTGNHKIQKLITALHIGYLYEYNVEFPRMYLSKTEGRTTRSDVNSKLTIHRIKLNFGKIGLYETTLTRVGKTDYTEIYESTTLDEYDVSDAPYLEEKIKAIPVYERNRNVNITLKSKHPAPATLRSMSWEGDWSPVNYRRV